MTMPQTVPMLKAEDFVIGPYEAHGGRLCLIGWMAQCFPGGDDEAYKAFDECCDDMGGSSITSTIAPDTRSNRKRAVRIWNEMLRRLRYTEDGPEMVLK